MKVITPTGRPIGEIAQETWGLSGSVATAARALLRGWSSRVDGWDKVGHVRFGIESGGRVIGSLTATDVNQWDFVIKDSQGVEIAVITKKWTGWLQERLTTADKYVLHKHRHLDEPLNSLVTAAAIAVDLALKQGDPALGGRGIYRPSA